MTVPKTMAPVKETGSPAFVNHHAAYQIDRLEAHLTEFFGQFLCAWHFLHYLAFKYLVVEFCQYLLANLAAAFYSGLQHGTETDA